MDWTVEQYHQMIDVGVLTEDHKVELLAGKIIEMNPVGRLHAACITTLLEYFFPRLNQEYTLRFENPVTLGDNSEPEPDFVVGIKSNNNYLEAHPKVEDIVVLCEVSDHTLKRDLEIKKGLYAEAGIPEYWIINLFEKELIQFTEPISAEASYKQQKKYGMSDTFEHPVIGTVEVAMLIPKQS
ncbi:MAG: Uma2 family endonuclease [Cyanobacteria bacterium J06649_11]